MALGITVTLADVVKEGNIITFTLNLAVTDGVPEVINEDYEARFDSSDPEKDLKSIVQGVEKKMQADIDAYKWRQTMLSHPKVTEAVTYLNTNLEG
jgi:hypothetical protein